MVVYHLSVDKYNRNVYIQHPAQLFMQHFSNIVPFIDLFAEQLGFELVEIQILHDLILDNKSNLGGL